MHRRPDHRSEPANQKCHAWFNGSWSAIKKLKGPKPKAKVRVIFPHDAPTLRLMVPCSWVIPKRIGEEIKIAVLQKELTDVGVLVCFEVFAFLIKVCVFAHVA